MRPHCKHRRIAGTSVLASILWAMIAWAGLGTVTAFMAVSPAEAANCGGLNQKPCPIWVRVPSCDKGLVEDFAKGICKAKPKRKPIIPRPKNCGRAGGKPCPLPHIPSCNGDLVEDFIRGICRESNGTVLDRARDSLNQSSTFVKQALLAMGNCASAGQLLKSRGARSGKANGLQELPCVKDLIEIAGRAGYRSLSIGLGSGASFGLGGDVEAGLVFDTALKNPPAFYTSKGFSLGLQAGIGANLVVGFGHSSNRPGTFQGHGAVVGFSAVGGSGASAWYNYDGTPDGLSVVSSVGGGFSAAYGRNETRISAIRGARVVTGESRPRPGPKNKSIAGRYSFENNPKAINVFRMVNDNLLQAANLKNGRPAKWHDYARINATTFRARSGTQTYQVLDNGNLLWKSNRSDKKRIVLIRR
ncbi:MAG: hypothetical protein ACFB6R_05760 [Alphaproteobacteria bacterium]